MTGFSLLELLISLTLFALALIGLHASQIVSLRQIQNAYYLNIANQQLINLDQQLRQSEVHDCFYGFSAWNQQNHLLLPQGKGTVIASYPYCHVELVWAARNEGKTIYSVILSRDVRLS